MRFKHYSAPRQDWDHDHCEGCWAKFMASATPTALTEGYVTTDNRWICPDCFHDLHEEMEWRLMEEEEDAQ